MAFTDRSHVIEFPAAGVPVDAAQIRDARLMIITFEPRAPRRGRHRCLGSSRFRRKLVMAGVRLSDWQSRQPAAAERAAVGAYRHMN